MPAGEYNIKVEQGTTFKKTITWKDKNGAVVNLTDYTGHLQIRQTVRNSKPALVNLTTENGGLTLIPLMGQILITMTPTQTNALIVDRALYSLVLTAPDGTVTRLLEGKVLVSQEVTF